MIVKLNKITKDYIADQYPAVHLWGTRVDNGEEWDRQFFENNQKLQEQLADFGIGDTINVRMVQKGQNWNIVSLEEPDPDMVEAIRGRGSDAPSPQGRPREQKGQKNYGKSSFNGRSGEAYDRSAAIYLAMDVIKTINTDAMLHKMEGSTILKHLLDKAEVINGYIHSGENPYLLTDDPLDPPQL